MTVDEPEPGSAFDGPGWDDRRGRRARGDHGTNVVRVRRRVESGKPRRLRWILGGTGLFVLLLAAAAGWLAYSAAQARHDLEAVRAGVQKLRVQIAAGDIQGARATANLVRAKARDAHDETTGPMWAMAAGIPKLGNPLATARTVTTSVDLLAGRALGSLIDASNGLQPSQLRRPDGSFDLTPLETLAPKIAGSQQVLAQALRELHSASGSTWSGSIDAARTELIDQVQQLQPTLASVHKAAMVVPELLGADGKRTYLLAFETEAEVRATGGVAGAFAVVQADHGKVTFTKFESDDYLTNTPVSVFGDSYDTLFQPAQQDVRDADYGPDFPKTAQIWAAMWHKRTGQQIDGVVAVDPTTLSYLLEATGPVTLQDGSELTAADVVPLTQNTLYYRYGALAQNAQRKQYLLDLARSVSTHLLGAKTDIGALVKAAAQGANESRLLMWTRDATVEKQLADEPLGGAIPTTRTRPYVAIGLDNDSQSKLDYWLHAKVIWQRASCGATSDVTVTVQLTNDDPAPSSMPPYIAGESDPKGENSTDVVVYGSEGATITGRTLNGQAPFFVQGSDSGHPVNIVTANLPRGRTETVVVHLKEPFVAGAPVVRAQPMINPMQVVVEDACG